MGPLDDALLAARMRALSTFAPDYFHDLKGPLNAIALRLEVLRSMPAGDAADQKRGTALNAMEEQVRRLDRLLHRWLTLTTHSETAADACDLRVLMQEIFALAAPAARKRGLPLAVEVPDDAVMARVAEATAGTLLLDLVRHALTGASGTACGMRLERNGGSARCHIHGAAFDDAATSLALRIASGFGGSCALIANGGPSAALLTLPLAS